MNTVADGGDDRAVMATAVRWILQELSRIAPGHAVEVRVPPFGAVQIVEGPGHTRGTPPNVIELDAKTLVNLALGAETWSAAVTCGAVSASGTRATLADLLPFRNLSE
jgi:hypothetical protein